MQIHGGYARGIDGHLFTASASPNDTGQHMRSAEQILAADLAEAETLPNRHPTT